MRINQRTRVRKYMEDFGGITSFEAYRELGITQLGARIHELKHIDGLAISYRWEQENNRYGETINYKRYFIKEA